MATKGKTHKGALKRLKITGTGKLSARKPNTGHLLSNKPGKTKRASRSDLIAPKTVAKMYERALHRRLKGREQA
jgi:large subunit ribosomal protein L35